MADGVDAGEGAFVPLGLVAKDSAHPLWEVLIEDLRDGQHLGAVGSCDKRDVQLAAGKERLGYHRLTGEARGEIPRPGQGGFGCRADGVALQSQGGVLAGGLQDPRSRDSVEYARAVRVQPASWGYGQPLGLEHGP